jgi:hypothetical protein
MNLDSCPVPVWYLVSGYSAMSVTEDGSGSTRIGSDTMSMTTITQAPSDESLTQKRNEYLERLSNRAIVVTRPKDFVKQGKKGQVLDVITNYFYMNKKPNFKLNQYRVDFSPREDLTYIKKQLLASHSTTIGAHIFDGHMLYMTSELKPEVSPVWFRSTAGRVRIQIQITSEYINVNVYVFTYLLC